MTSHDEDDDVNGESSGIVRSKLFPDSARDRFGSSKVDARNVDFSTRAAGARRYYKTRNRRRREIRASDDETDGSTDSDEEDLERRMARLRQEIEEVKVAMEAQRAIPVVEKNTSNQQDGENIQQLSDALDAVYKSRPRQNVGPEAELLQRLRQPFTSQSTNGQIRSKPAGANNGLTDRQVNQALFKTAEFDSRLARMEHALGLTGNSMPDTASDGAQPILHHLDKLDRQVHIIANTPATVDSASQKTQQLSKDLDKLNQLRAAQGKNGTATTTDSYPESEEQTSKINALYGALPVIDGLSPTLPLVLERLRTLQALHGSAASAGQVLDDIEKRQNEQEAELKQWREAITKVEDHLKKGEGSLAENVKTVGDWVKDLEKRLEKFS